MKQLKTPVLLMIFNRPETTRVVFEEIRKARPERLFIAGDGPRADRPDDVENVRQAREIAKQVDWPCDVKTLFQEKNLGCHRGPPTAIDWFFEHVEAGIILEDDCVPDQSFFPFCTELLERYADDARIMQIGGNCFQKKNQNFNPAGGYYFSSIPYLWGWATWRRAWKYYDIEMRDWPEVRKSGLLQKLFPNPAVREYWEYLWNRYYEGPRNSWDRPWHYACLRREGLSINPIVNLVANEGFGPEATHTKTFRDGLDDMPLETIRFPLVHPDKVQEDRGADAFIMKYQFDVNKTLRERIAGPLRRSYPRLYAQLKSLLGRK